MTDRALRLIRDAGLRHNEPAGVYGVLLYRDGTFLQLLEGPRGAVEETFARIRTDPRHTDVRVLYEGPCTAPIYTHYNMGVIAGKPGSNPVNDSIGYLTDKAYRVAESSNGFDVSLLVKEIIDGFARFGIAA